MSEVQRFRSDFDVLQDEWTMFFQSVSLLLDSWQVVSVPKDVGVLSRGIEGYHLPQSQCARAFSGHNHRIYKFKYCHHHLLQFQPSTSISRTSLAPPLPPPTPKTVLPKVNPRYCGICCEGGHNARAKKHAVFILYLCLCLLSCSVFVPQELRCVVVVMLVMIFLDLVGHLI